MAVWAWRLGLGWLVGRWLLLVSTVERREAVPFRFFAGTFYVRASDLPWLDTSTAPALTIQAWPGPRSVKGRALTAEESELAAELWGGSDELIALSPTGQRSPEMVAPDLVWLWPVAILAVILAKRISE